MTTEDALRIGVGVIIRKDDQVLLVRRKDSHGDGTWATPGGHLDFGESPDGCAAREAHEETGVLVDGLRLRAVTNDIFEAEGKHYVTLWMEGNYASGEAIVRAEEELSEVGWFNWDALPQPLFLAFENLLSGRSVPQQQGTADSL